MLTLAMGAGAAKILGIISMPIITRLYAPQDFGVLSLFTSMVLILGPLMALRLPVVIPLPRNRRVAGVLFATCFVFSAVNCAIVALFVFLFSETIFNIFDADILVDYWWLLALAVFMTSLYEIMSSWALRNKNFIIIARTQASQAISGASVKIFLGWFYGGVSGLLYGQFFQQAGGIASMVLAFRTDVIFAFSGFRKRLALKVVSCYFDVIKYRLPSQFLLVACMQGPMLFCLAQYGSSTGGQMALALNVLAIPIGLIGATTANAFYAEISRIGKNNNTKLYIMARDTFIKLAAFSLAPFLVIFFAGGIIFSVMFGEQWLLAGKLAGLLSISIVFQFCSAPLINVLTLYGMHKKFLMINFVRVVIVASAMACAYYFDVDILFFALIYSLALSVHYALVSFGIFSVIREKRALSG